eukprot:6009422-Pyramimonas_sp.AAC.1
MFSRCRGNSAQHALYIWSFGPYQSFYLPARGTGGEIFTRGHLGGDSGEGYHRGSHCPIPMSLRHTVSLFSVPLRA